ncbi:MAG: hypothetical protein ABSD42_09285 [Candidatus Bathyarchaeia archaeon]|jgi:hypothetical protein
MSKPLTSTPISTNRNRNIGIAVAVILIVLIVATVAGFYVLNGSGSTGIPLQTPTPTPTLTSIPTIVNSIIQVSGTVTFNMNIAPTQIQFTNTVTNLTYTAPIQNGHYNITLPNHQSYNVICNWQGITFIKIQMSPTLNINARVGVTSITQNFSA